MMCSTFGMQQVVGSHASITARGHPWVWKGPSFLTCAVWGMLDCCVCNSFILAEPIAIQTIKLPHSSTATLQAKHC